MDLDVLVKIAVPAVEAAANYPGTPTNYRTESVYDSPPLQFKLLDPFGVDFLSVPAVIGVARHAALRITDKCDASEIIFKKERIGTQRLILILIFREL